MSPLGGLGLYVGQSATSPTPGVLTVDRTIHVDSAAGSDSNDGSAALPFATLARAWTERLTYGELRAKLIVQLHGVGPYTMPVMGASVCGVGGYFILRGDETVDVVAATGTFTGDVSTSTFVVNTSAGLGSDTKARKFLYITSGNCNGVRSTILANTDTTLSLPLADWRTTLGAIANGDTFAIKTPGTVINIPATASGQTNPGFVNCTGGGYPSGAVVGNTPQRHWVIGISFTGATAHNKESALLVAGCTFTTARFQYYRCSVTIGGLANGNALGVGADSKTDMLTGYGVGTDSGSLFATGSHTLLCGYASSSFATFGSGSIGDETIFNGVRFDLFSTVNGGRVEGFSSSLNIIKSTITVMQGGQLIMNAGRWTFAVTSGDCVLAQDAGLVVLTTAGGAVFTGGTSAGSGYGLRAISGGKIICQNFLPTLTGGTLNNDIKAESTAAIANATLGSNGTSTLDAVTQAIVMRVAA